MKKELAELHSDEEAEAFVANADLTEYDLSELRTAIFEFQPKSERVNMRLPKPLLAAEGIGAQGRDAFQRSIRQGLEAAVGPSAGKG